MDTHQLTNAPVAPPQPLTTKQVREWLDFSGQELLERRDDIIPALAATLQAHPTIADGDEDTAGLLAENIRIAEVLVRDINAERTTAKKPYLDGGRAVDDWARVITEAVTRVLAPVKAVATAFAIRKADLARAEAQRIAQETEAAAAAAAAKAREATSKSLFGITATQALEEAAWAADAARNAQNAARAKPTLASRTVGHYGAQASLRTTWNWEIEDFDKIPLEFLQVNDEAVKAAMKQRDPISGKPTRVIPGIKWKETATLGVR